MARVKRGVTTHARHKKILKMAQLKKDILTLTQSHTQILRICKPNSFQTLLSRWKRFKHKTILT